MPAELLGDDRLPESPDELTPSWLTAALGLGRGSSYVSNVTRRRVVHGAATKVCLELEYGPVQHEVELPLTMWAKGGWEDHSPWVESFGIYSKEARFYRDHRDDVRFDRPDCYYAAFDERGRGVMLLEDLEQRSVVFGDCTVPATPDTVARMLEGLARMHGTSWGAGPSGQWRWLDLPLRADHPSAGWMRANGPDVIEERLASPRCAAIPDHVRDPKRIDAAIWSEIAALPDAHPCCLLHGDVHPNNSYFDTDGTPGLFDWSTVSWGPWAYDVSYYVVSAMDVPTRQRHDKDLLRHYLERLASHGVEDVPTFDDAWLAFRRHIAYGLHIWITNRTDFQSEENCTALSTRFGQAAADYELFEAWGV